MEAVAVPHWEILNIHRLRFLPEPVSACLCASAENSAGNTPSLNTPRVFHRNPHSQLTASLNTLEKFERARVSTAATVTEVRAGVHAHAITHRVWRLRVGRTPLRLGAGGPHALAGVGVEAVARHRPRLRSPLPADVGAAARAPRPVARPQARRWVWRPCACLRLGAGGSRLTRSRRAVIAVVGHLTRLRPCCVTCIGKPTTGAPASIGRRARLGTRGYPRAGPRLRAGARNARRPIARVARHRPRLRARGVAVVTETTTAAPAPIAGTGAGRDRARPCLGGAGSDNGTRPRRTVEGAVAVGRHRA